MRSKLAGSMSKQVVRTVLGTLILLVVLAPPMCSSGEMVSVALRSGSILAGSEMFASSMLLDAQGTPRLAFIGGAGQRELRYQSGAAPAETVTMIGVPDQTEFSFSLALNSDGVPGIAYEQHGQLLYSVRRVSGWVSEPVDLSDQVGYFASLTYDRADRPQISYFDQRHNDIKYATQVAGAWQIETIDASGQPGFHIPAGFTRIAVGCWPQRANCATGQPQVAYLVYRYKPYDGELRYAVRRESGWQISTVDADRGAGGFPSLALDPAGLPWISYYRASTWDFAWGELRLAHFDGRRWRVETLDQGEYVGRYNALALDPAGQPVLAYYAANAPNLRLIWNSGAWQRVAVSEGAGAWVTLGIDQHSTLHLTFVDLSDQQTHYATLLLPDLAQRKGV